MTRIIKRWERALYYLMILLFAVLFMYINIWAKGNVQIAKIGTEKIDHIYAYLFILLFYIFQWGSYKLAESRIMKLSFEWKVINAFSDEKNKKITIIFLVLNLLALIGISTGYGRFMLLLFAIMNRYIESKLNNGYLDSKHFIVKHKMYALDGIIAIKDEFGTNFTIYYETESYQIFTGSDLIKDEILSVLSDKRRISL